MATFYVQFITHVFHSILSSTHNELATTRQIATANWNKSYHTKQNNFWSRRATFISSFIEFDLQHLLRPTDNIFLVHRLWSSKFEQNHFLLNCMIFILINSIPESVFELIWTDLTASDRCHQCHHFDIWVTSKNWTSTLIHQSRNELNQWIRGKLFIKRLVELRSEESFYVI